MTGREDESVRDAGRLIAVSAVCVGLGASLGFLPGFLATTLIDDLDVSRGEVGLLVSLHFGCTGVGSILGGKATELLGARIVVVADMVIVALSATFAALVGRYWALLVAAVFAGGAYALSNAGTNVAIGRSVPARHRTMAMSLKTAGVPLMAVVAGGLGPPIAGRVGWQPVLLTTAVIAVVTAVTAALTFGDDRPPRRVRRVAVALPPGFVWFPIGAFLLVAGSQPLYSWIVAYLEQAVDASPALAGAVAAGASACGVVVMIVSARFADREGPDERMRRLAALVVATTGGVGLVLVGEFVGPAVVAVGAIIGIGAQLAAIGTMHAAVVDRAPGAVARATGVTMTGYYVGALVSPAAFGALVDATDTYTWSWALTTLVVLAALPAWLVAARPAPASTGGVDADRRATI